MSYPLEDAEIDCPAGCLMLLVLCGERRTRRWTVAWYEDTVLSYSLQAMWRLKRYKAAVSLILVNLYSTELRNARDIKHFRNLETRRYHCGRREKREHNKLVKINSCQKCCK